MVTAKARQVKLNRVVAVKTCAKRLRGFSDSFTPGARCCGLWLNTKLAKSAKSFGFCHLCVLYALCGSISTFALVQPASAATVWVKPIRASRYPIACLLAKKVQESEDVGDVNLTGAVICIASVYEQERDAE